tara:strand:- start:447 stop:638 length:192 start_codon:yes stop_codon:yes gene_type:complete
MRHTRRVPKDKASGLPKKYLSGIKGSDRERLAQIIQRISRLYRAGKNVPQSLLDERIRLGRKR